MSLVVLAQKVIDCMHRNDAETCFVDQGGVGAGLVDILNSRGVNVVGINFGSGPDGTNTEPHITYANKRAEMYGAVKAWLPRGCIPDLIPGSDASLVEQLSAPTYDHQLKTEAIVLEPKKAIKLRLGISPDDADALALTFAFPMFDTTSGRVVAPQTDYNPFAEERL